MDYLSIVIVGSVLVHLILLWLARSRGLSKETARLEEVVKDEFMRNRAETQANARESRDELTAAIRYVASSTNETIEKMSSTNEQRLERMRETVERSLRELQEDNSRQIERMRQTVDEKLHKTLEQRIGESFRLVSERLEQVHQGLGEMQNLASGVGDLKRVLANVKTRGMLGEIQLESVLADILSRNQYSKNVATKEGSRDRVEFAIRLPGRERERTVLLPLDAKFPLDVYHGLVDAYEAGNQTAIDQAGRRLDQAIRKSAKDIQDKYLNPPTTTDFAVMFLPVEGLYAEVMRRMGLWDSLQRDYKVIVTGPSTLAALLNSLQMGFRTLAIEQRSSEVWQVLGAIKTEFATFAGVLGKTQKKLNQASQDLDTLVGVRTRQIQRKLRAVQNAPIDSAAEPYRMETAAGDSDDEES